MQNVASRLSEIDPLTSGHGSGLSFTGETKYTSDTIFWLHSHIQAEIQNRTVGKCRRMVSTAYVDADYHH